MRWRTRWCSWNLSWNWLNRCSFLPELLRTVPSGHVIRVINIIVHVHGLVISVYTVNASQVVSAKRGNVPNLYSRAFRNDDAQSVPNIARDLARLRQAQYQAAR